MTPDAALLSDRSESCIFSYERGRLWLWLWLDDVPEEDVRDRLLSSRSRLEMLLSMLRPEGAIAGERGVAGVLDSRAVSVTSPASALLAYVDVEPEDWRCEPERKC
jgi:hypothetical protein